MLLVRLCRTRRCPVLNSYIDFNIGHFLIKNNEMFITFLLQLYCDRKAVYSSFS